MSQQNTPPDWTPQPPQGQQWGAGQLSPQHQVPPRKKHRLLKVLGFGAAGIVVLAIGVNLGGGDDPTVTANPTASVTPSESPSVTPPAEPDETPVAEAAPVEAESSTEAVPKSVAPAPVPKEIKYTGRGDKILTITKPDSNGIGYAAITHKGSSNFVVETVGSEQLLVNEIGKYSGRILFDMAEGEDTKRLKITANGSWTVTALPMEKLRRFKDKISGEGDDVIVYVGDGGVADIKHTGESNFAVQTYNGDGRELLVNEIGSYSGEQLLPADGAIVEITADGDWSFKVTED